MRADYSQKFVDICRPKVAERDVNVFGRISFAPVNYYPTKRPRLNEELAGLCPLNLDFCYLIISNEPFPPAGTHDHACLVPEHPVFHSNIDKNRERSPDHSRPPHEIPL